MMIKFYAKIIKVLRMSKTLQKKCCFYENIIYFASRHKAS